MIENHRNERAKRSSKALVQVARAQPYIHSSFYNLSQVVVVI